MSKVDMTGYKVENCISVFIPQPELRRAVAAIAEKNGWLNDTTDIDGEYPVLYCFNNWLSNAGEGSCVARGAVQVTLEDFIRRISAPPNYVKATKLTVGTWEVEISRDGWLTVRIAPNHRISFTPEDARRIFQAYTETVI